TLAATSDSHVWHSTPSAGVKGPIRIRLTHPTPAGVVTVQTRIFGIANEAGFVPPAPGERSDPNATRANATDPAVIDRCERNWPTSDFPAGNPFGWGPDLLLLVAGGGGGGGSSADQSVVVSDTTANLAVDTSYYVESEVTVTLPDATS